MLHTLHLPPFHVCLKGFKAPILGDFDLRTPQNWGQGGGSGDNLGLLRGLEFTFLRNRRFLKNVGNDKQKKGRGAKTGSAPLLPHWEKGLGDKGVLAYPPQN